MQNSIQIPILLALVLGLLGAVSPCQLSTNASAIAYVSRGSSGLSRTAALSVAYLGGKALMYSAMGFAFLGIGFQASDTIPFITAIRYVFGPLLIVAGLLMTGIIRVPLAPGAGIYGWGLRRLGGSGVRGAFLLGVAFSFIFCPTMFVLFFMALLPLALQSRGGLLFPGVFALGTAMPMMGLSTVASVGLSRARGIGQLVQRAAGVVFVLAGLWEIYYYYIYGA